MTTTLPVKKEPEAPFFPGTQAITPGAIVYHVLDPLQTAGEVAQLLTDDMALVYSQGQQYQVPVADLVLVHAAVRGSAFGGASFHGHAAAVSAAAAEPTAAAAWPQEHQWPMDASAIEQDDEDMVHFPLDILPAFVDATLSDPLSHASAAPFGATAPQGTAVAISAAAPAPAPAPFGELDWGALNLPNDMDTTIDALTMDSYISSLGEMDVQYN